MSTELWSENEEMPSGTRFWGGEKRGVCLQLTKREKDDGFQYITIAYDAIPKLIKKLERLMMEGL